MLMADRFIVIFIVHNSSNFLLSRSSSFPLSRFSAFPFLSSLSPFPPPFFPPSVHFPSSFPPQISLQHHCALFSRPFPWGRLENSIIVRRLHGSRCYQCNREFTNIKKRLVHIHLFWVYYVLRRKELHIYHSVNKYFLATKNKTTTAWQIGILLT